MKTKKYAKHANSSFVNAAIKNKFKVVGFDLVKGETTGKIYKENLDATTKLSNLIKVLYFYENITNDNEDGARYEFSYIVELPKESNCKYVYISTLFDTTCGSCSWFEDAYNCDKLVFEPHKSLKDLIRSSCTEEDRMRWKLSV